MKDFVSYYLSKGLHLNHLLVDYYSELPVWFHKGFTNWLCFLSYEGSGKISESDNKASFDRFVFGHDVCKYDELVNIADNFDSITKHAFLKLLDEVGIKNV